MIVYGSSFCMGSLPWRNDGWSSDEFIGHTTGWGIGIHAGLGDGGGIVLGNIGYADEYGLDDGDGRSVPT